METALVVVDEHGGGDVHRVGTKILVTTDSASKDETPSKKQGEMAWNRMQMQKRA
jgi:hypothetical protein